MIPRPHLFPSLPSATPASSVLLCPPFPPLPLLRHDCSGNLNTQSTTLAWDNILFVSITGCWLRAHRTELGNSSEAALALAVKLGMRTVAFQNKLKHKLLFFWFLSLASLLLLVVVVVIVRVKEVVVVVVVVVDGSSSGSSSSSSSSSK